jgi:uncharacterized phiE125 gp8 family phage protein
MTIVVYTAAATEPLTVAEVMAHCRIDASNTEPAPGIITAALAGTPIAGNVDNGAHRYLATFVTANGETQAGTVSAVVTVTDKTVNGKVSLTAIPLGGSLVTSRKIYRTAAGGSTYLLLATIADNTTTTYTDNIADSSLGAGAPSTNTTTDPLINVLIASARAAAEQELHRYLITQTLDAYFDEFPAYPNDRFAIGRHFRLPPLQSVTSITYVDTDGVTQTLAADQYLVDAKSQPARIDPAYGVSWPSTREQSNAVIVRFIAGYGAASAVPACIKNWMLLRIASAWDNRSALVAGPSGMIELPPCYVDGLLDSERVVGRLFA